ncbi:hypothetical protein C8F04DRAFT_1228098 [Mycena alexandri]|uniref:Uncharacterized protein n=1 Tax=Mycena alexandri TaxID=1745969 RepID=A0AAD6THA4_9AGAR|nr:hypothetical protein C8F04DRAFT_1228098 [Mycena alexandri]
MACKAKPIFPTISNRQGYSETDSKEYRAWLERALRGTSKLAHTTVFRRAQLHDSARRDEEMRCYNQRDGNVQQPGQTRTGAIYLIVDESNGSILGDWVTRRPFTLSPLNVDQLNKTRQLLATIAKVIERNTSSAFVLLPRSKDDSFQPVTTVLQPAFCIHGAVTMKIAQMWTDAARKRAQKNAVWEMESVLLEGSKPSVDTVLLEQDVAEEVWRRWRKVVLIDQAHFKGDT